MKYLAFALGFGMFYGFIGCNNHKTNAHNGDIKQEKETSPFQNWLVDTLQNTDLFLAKELKDSVGLLNYKIILGKDSLSLEIIRTYKVSNPLLNQNKSQVIKSLIDLLVDYEELPSQDFNLSFATSYYYYPSSIKQRPYDFLFEIREIVLEEPSTSLTYKYGYIRGRLSDKEVIKNLPNGELETTTYDFIWDGDKLIKKNII